MSDLPGVLLGLKSRLNKGNLLKYSLLASSMRLFIAFWWLLSLYLYGQNFFYLPTPNEVLTAWLTSVNRDPATGLPLLTNVLSSLTRFFSGFFLAFAIAVPLGLLIGYSSLVEAFSKPVIEILRPIAPIAWVPFLLVSLGFFWGPVITIFIGVIFPILSNVVFGVRSVDPLLLDVAKTQGASETQIFTKIYLPSSVPFIMTGVKVGVGVGWMCIVAAEFQSAKGGGVGSIIVSGMGIGRPDITFAGMLTIAILGILTLWGTNLIERGVLKWMGMK
jgi:NitT/TauT family transport system permease protein